MTILFEGEGEPSPYRLVYLRLVLSHLLMIAQYQREERLIRGD